MKSELPDEALADLGKLQSALEGLLAGAPPPKMTTVSDKDGTHLNGNQSSYVRLAVNCLTAAQGRPVSLWQNASWLQTGGWRFSSLQVSPEPRNWGWPDTSRKPTLLYVFSILLAVLVNAGLWTVAKAVYLLVLRPSP